MSISIIITLYYYYYYYTESLSVSRAFRQLISKESEYTEVQTEWKCHLFVVTLWLATIVAPSRVDWLYQVGDSEARLASNGDQLRLRQNVHTTLTCRVTVQRTDFRPEVVVALDGREITGRTTVNTTRLSPTTEGGFARLPDWTVDHQLRWDASVANEFHDKNLSCFAVMKHFSPLSSFVRLSIACKSHYYYSLLLRSSVKHNIRTCV